MKSGFDWKSIIEEQERTGNPVANFCREKKISTSCFYLHKKKYSSNNSYLPPIERNPVAQFVKVDSEILKSSKQNPEVVDLIFRYYGPVIPKDSCRFSNPSDIVFGPGHSCRYHRHDDAGYKPFSGKLDTNHETPFLVHTIAAHRYRIYVKCD